VERALRLRPTTFILLAILIGAAYLLQQSYWPTGSPNMLVSVDGTLVRLIQVEETKGRILWRVRSPLGRAAATLGVVRYGAVPPGFAQEIPVAGVPRPFLTDELLTIHVVSEQMDMAEGGRARSPNTFLELVYFDTPLKALSVSEAMRLGLEMPQGQRN
jgi:hypothetical protein